MRFAEWFQDQLLTEQNNNVPQVELGNTGIRTGRLSLGTGAFHFNPTLSQVEVDRIINTLADVGANLLDTSADYPNDAEGKIGKTIKNRRDDFILVTKCGHKTGELKGTDWSVPLIEASINRSLKRLGTDYIDVILLHSADLDILKKGDVFEALIRAKEAGKVGHIGYSGDNEEVAFSLKVPEVTVIETSVSFCDLANIKYLNDIREKGIGILAKRSIANACWKPKSRQYKFNWGYSKPYRERLKVMGINPVEMGFDNDDDINWVRMALPFTFSFPIDVGIVGMTVLDHVREDIEIAKMESDEEIARELAKVWQSKEQDWEGQM